MVTVAATHLLGGRDGAFIDDAVLGHEHGVITSIETGRPGQGPRRLVIPALVNAHDHARPTLSSFGAVGMPLESWIARSALATPPDPYLVAASALARAARAGCGAMMIHYTRPSGAMPLVDEARAIARAASDVGLRVAFALALRDQNPLVYGDADDMLAAMPAAAAAIVRETFVKPAPSPHALVALTEDIAAAIGSPMVDVQFGPAGVQWCSPPLLEAVAEASARSGRRVHMHLLETAYQRRWADRHFPGGIVRYLKDIGLLSERLTLAHCVHATPAELEMIAQSGARIVTNFSSNLHLGSGLAPIAAAHRCGCGLAVGVDGLALDEDDDLLREMRLVQMMHGGTGFARTWSAGEFFALALRNGRRAVGAPGEGVLAAGEVADFAVLDFDRLDRDAIMPVDPMALLFARGNSALVREVVVAGRTIVADGVPTGVDLAAIDAELRRLYRAGLVHHHRLAAAWPDLAAGLANWFEDFAGCG
jgi:cytosine/adenosine deaminase-related metal-dependent hydrolase